MNKINLTNHEITLIEYFRTMDDKTKDFFLGLGEYYANQCRELKSIKKEIIANIDNASESKIKDLLTKELENANQEDLKALLKLKLERDICE